MTTRNISLAIITLALTSLACSSSLSLPSSGDSARGPLMTETLRVPAPEGEPIELLIGFAAGTFEIEPGAEEALVEGTARYDIEQLAPRVETEGSEVRLTTGEVHRLDDLDFDFNFNLPMDERINEWSLALGHQPMALHINGGAFEGRAELGGLSLTRLDVSSGASDLEIRFSKPNRVTMESISVNAGASSLGLEGLGNARFQELRFQGGAGEFRFDFSGDMTEDARATIEAGLASVELVVPQSLNARIQVDGTLTDVDAPSGFSRSGDTYLQEGSGPSLQISVAMGAGALTIRRP
jgi:hypothetical protein